MKAWEKAAEEAEAYRIGNLESKASMQLLTGVDAPIFEKLSDIVRTAAPVHADRQTPCVSCYECSRRGPTG